MWLFLLQLVVVLAGLSVILSYRVPFYVGTVGFALLLGLLSYYTTPPYSFLTLCWLLWLATTVCLGVTPLRHKLLTKPILQWIQKVLPPMSDTERMALEAGDLWWEAEFFQGKPNWKKLMKTSLPGLSDEEKAFVDNQVETLCGLLDDWKIVHENYDLPPAVWDYLKKERFFGLVIPKEYGGRGFSALAHSTIVTKIASRSMSAAVSTMVPNSLGPGELLYHYGTDQQKQYYLPRLARGEEIPCFGLTALEAGSDATALPDTGIVCKGEFDGQTITGIRLNFDKRYITLAPVATVIGIAFKLYDPNHLLSEQEDRGITLCLIPANHRGVESGHRHLPSKLAFMNGPVRGKDVFIPLDWIIGGPAMIGHGWRMLVECLSIGRSISLPALSTAAAQVSYRTTGAYAMLRKQFKLPLARFEGVEEGLACIAGYTYIINAARRLTAAAVDSHIKPALASAIAKYHMTELARKTVDHAMDIHAGRAVQYGPRNYLGLVHQAIPISITVEGANILTRNLMIFGQGAMRCHPYVREEVEAATQNNFERFDELLFTHIGYTASNFVRTLVMGLGGSRLLPLSVHKNTAALYRQLTRMSAALAFVSDITLLTLGGALKRKERLSARLGDVLSHLYLAASVLKTHADQNYLLEELPSVQWCVQYCLFNIQNAFSAFFDNFPLRAVAAFLKRTVFPWGYPYRAPSDNLGHKMVAAMLEPCALRDRSTLWCYIGNRDTDPINRVEKAFQLQHQTLTLEKKLQQAIHSKTIPGHLTLEEQLSRAVSAGVLTTLEAQQLQQAETARRDALIVDEFPPEYLTKNSRAAAWLGSETEMAGVEKVL